VQLKKNANVLETEIQRCLGDNHS